MRSDNRAIMEIVQSRPSFNSTVISSPFKLFLAEREKGSVCQTKKGRHVNNRENSKMACVRNGDAGENGREGKK